MKKVVVLLTMALMTFGCGDDGPNGAGGEGGTGGIILPPDVSGSMTFEDTGGGNLNATREQSLSFVIDTFIEAFSAQVIVTTDSVTEFSGTGTGTLPGTIALDPLTLPSTSTRQPPAP